MVLGLGSCKPECPKFVGTQVQTKVSQQVETGGKLKGAESQIL